MNTNKLFLKSALTLSNPFISVEQVKQWLENKNLEVIVNIQEVEFDEMIKWSFHNNNSILSHDSGSFFSIVGINVKTNWGNVEQWDQPIINQPEIGYLGIITKEINGILYFLLQGKIEPGNVNNIQLSPTLQATKSNYTQVHQGKRPLYLEYFTNALPNQILLDQLQSEQGARFLKKRNRNIIIKIEDEIEINDDFIWLTLGQIKELLNYDNLINMDTRTVIAGITFNDIDFYSDINLSSNNLGTELLTSAFNSDKAINTFDNILFWLTALKSKYELNVIQKPLNLLNDWEISKTEIKHRENLFFKIIAAKVEISNREVSSWFQPLVKPMQTGLIVFILKKINGVLHFLVQAKVEPGNFDIIELAPTVQCLTGSYKDSDELPYLNYVLNAKNDSIFYNTMQSEEGGRFYREQNRSMFILADDNFSEMVPSNYKWLTLYQLTTFLKFNNFLNIQTRSLISTIKYI